MTRSRTNRSPFDVTIRNI